MKQFVLGTAILLMWVRPAAAQRANTFVPAVTVDDSTARCEEESAIILQPDERGYLLRFSPGAPAGSPQRVVAAVWDTTGRLRRYSDARGDLRGPPVPRAERGERTTILIDFIKGIGLLTNEFQDRDNHGTLTTASDVLNAERLGPPMRLLERLHTQCGAPAPK